MTTTNTTIIELPYIHHNKTGHFPPTEHKKRANQKKRRLKKQTHNHSFLK